MFHASDGYIRGANTESVPINDLVDYHHWKEFLPTSSCPSLCHHGGMAFYSWPAEHASSHYWVTATVSNYKHVTYVTNIGLPDEGCIIIIDQSAKFCIAWHQEKIQRWCGFPYLTWWLSVKNVSPIPIYLHVCWPCIYHYNSLAKLRISWNAITHPQPIPSLKPSFLNGWDRDGISPFFSLLLWEVEY